MLKTPIQMRNNHNKYVDKTAKTAELHSDLEPASLGEILDPLEWLVLLPVHVQPVHLEPTHSQLADGELEAVKRNDDW